MTNKIKQTRQDAGFTRAELSRQTGIPTRTIENWETGTRKPPEWTERLVVNEIKRLKEIKLEEIKMLRMNKLNSLSAAEAVKVYNHMIDTIEELDQMIIFKMEEFEEQTEGMEAEQIERLKYEGTWNEKHEWFVFNGHGDLVTMDDEHAKEMAIEGISTAEYFEEVDKMISKDNKRFLVEYNTGAGNVNAKTLDEAMEKAESGMAYTGLDVDIYDNGELVLTSKWYGVEAGEDDYPVATFGTSGFYGPWVEM